MRICNLCLTAPPVKVILLYHLSLSSALLVYQSVPFFCWFFFSFHLNDLIKSHLWNISSFLISIIELQCEKCVLCQVIAIIMELLVDLDKVYTSPQLIWIIVRHRIKIPSYRSNSNNYGAAGRFG